VKELGICQFAWGRKLGGKAKSGGMDDIWAKGKGTLAWVEGGRPGT